MAETVLRSRSNDTVWLTLNRPDRKNALNARLRLDLTTALRESARDARVIVVTGAGDSFCAGQDLADASGAGAADIRRVLQEEYAPLIRAIVDCPVPVVAAVNGAAAGAGANLALAADVVIAAESAVFVQAFGRVGLMPDAGGTYWLPRQVGLPRAMGAVLFGEPITAREAEAWGLIWESVADAAFTAHVAARAAQLAAGPTLALGHAKAALRQGLRNDLETQLALEADGQAACGTSRDFAEGLVAFHESRPPRFEGR